MKCVWTITYIIGTSRDCKVCTPLPELHGNWIFSIFIETKNICCDLKCVLEVSWNNEIHYEHLLDSLGVPHDVWDCPETHFKALLIKEKFVIFDLIQIPNPF